MATSYSWKSLLHQPWRTQLLRLLVLLVASVIIALLLATPYGNEFSDLREGVVSPQDVDAPFDFEILKEPDRLAQERFEARRTVPPVVELNDTLSRRYRAQFAQLTLRLETGLKSLTQLSGQTADTAARDFVAALYAEFRFYLPREQLDWLIERYLSDNQSVLNAFARWRSIQSSLLTQGILREVDESLGTSVTAKDAQLTSEREIVSFVSELDLPETLLSRLRDQEPSEDWIRTGYTLLRPMLSANWQYNARATEELRDAAANNVPSAQGVVLKGERIVDRGKRIDTRQIAILHSLMAKRSETYSTRGMWGIFLPRIGTGFAVFAILLFWAIALLLLRPERFRRISDLILAVLLLVVPIAVFAAGLLPAKWSFYYFPAGAVALSLAILFDVEIALVGTAVLTGLATVISDGAVAMVLFSLLSGITALTAAARVGIRAQLFRATPVLLTVAAILIGARAAVEMLWSSDTTSDLIAASITALATPLLVFGIVYLAEKGFRITTDLTYLELADFNRPILRRLALEAPGTFHHSILVGALAEAGARAVGANPVLARCAAYYHDIGKIEASDFFIENQSGIPNPHEQITPEASADVLRRHVQRGIEQARELKLPEEVIAAIPEHHGTMMMAFFRNLALREQGTVNDSIFRYMGPKPQSKETALLMLADGCEAISRTLKDNSREALQVAIRRAIHDRLDDGQLEEAPITFIDLQRIETVFAEVLDGILHKRIDYSKPK